MTKLRKDTDNALYLIRFEERFGAVDIYYPISGLNEYPVFHSLSSLCQLMDLNNTKFVQCFIEIESAKQAFILLAWPLFEEDNLAL